MQRIVGTGKFTQSGHRQALNSIRFLNIIWRAITKTEPFYVWTAKKPRTHLACFYNSKINISLLLLIQLYMGNLILFKPFNKREAHFGKQTLEFWQFSVKRFSKNHLFVHCNSLHLLTLLQKRLNLSSMLKSGVSFNSFIP